MITLIDGPMGSELEARGGRCPAPEWTSRPLAERPELVRAIHADYAAAGADIHTAATFRAHERSLAGTDLVGRWHELATRAVDLARLGASTDSARAPCVAGAIAPLMDCYRPDLTPDDAALAREHAQLAVALDEAGCDLLLVETMPTLRELVAATAAAAATGLPVWSAITLGPTLDFFSRAEIIEAQRRAADAGASAFLLNCTPADIITQHIDALADAASALPFGAYANAIFAGHTDWPVARYVDEASQWVARGATLIGGCCGTSPLHMRALRAAWPRTPPHAPGPTSR